MTDIRIIKSTGCKVTFRYQCITMGYTVCKFNNVTSDCELCIETFCPQT